MANVCPRCAVTRSGAGRYCPQCAYDYWGAAAGYDQTTSQAAAAPPGSPPTAPRQAAGWRRNLRRGVGAVVVIGALYIVGTVLAQPDDESAGVDATPTERATSTARPTLRATATAEASINLDALAFELFVLHVSPLAAEIGQDLQRVGADASALDIDALTESSVALWLKLGDEVSWLVENPPRTCYAELHAEYSRAVATLYDALDLISDGAIYTDPDLLLRGNTRLSEGSQQILAATDLFEAAEAACSGT